MTSFPQLVKNEIMLPNKSEKSRDRAVFAFGGNKGATPSGFHDAVAAINEAMAEAESGMAKAESSGGEMATGVTKKAKKDIFLGDCCCDVDSLALSKWLVDKLNCHLCPSQLDALIEVFGHQVEGIARLDQLLLGVLAAGTRVREVAAFHTEQSKIAVEPRKETDQNQSIQQKDNSGRLIVSNDGDEQLTIEERDAFRRSALKKLALAARNYWFRKGNIDRMRGSAMDAEIFGHNLKTNFQLNLHPAELKHLVQIFDVDGDGKVDCAEFISLFLRLVDEERKKQFRAKKAANQRRSEILQGADFKQRAKKRDIKRVKWAQADLRRAAAKLAETAVMSTCGRGIKEMEAFYCKEIEGWQFVSMVHTILGVKLNNAEAAAIIMTLAKCGSERSGKDSSHVKFTEMTKTGISVDGRKFMRLWTALAREEKKYYASGELTFT